MMEQKFLLLGRNEISSLLSRVSCKGFGVNKITFAYKQDCFERYRYKTINSASTFTFSAKSAAGDPAKKFE